MKYEFEHQWGGEETWYTKARMWARNQKYPLNQLALGVIEWLWKHWVDGRVQMEISDVDKQTEEIKKQWKEEEKKEPIVEIKPSDIEGLDEVSISAPYKVDWSGDWNDIAINYKKWR